MNTRTRFIGMGLLVAACAIAFAAQDAITLKYAPKQGDTTKFKMTGQLDVGGQSATITGDVTNTVTKADADGYTQEEAQTNVHLSFNGQDIPAPDNKTTTTYKSNGEITDIQADQVTPEVWRISELTNFVYPDKAVKVGDEWTYKVVPDDKKGTVAATCDYKVDSTEKIGTHDTFKIKVSYKEDGGNSAATNDGYSWVDTATGLVIKSTTTWTNVPLGPNASPVNGTFSMELAS